MYDLRPKLDDCYAIVHRGEELDTCPCCGLPFSLDGAKATILKLKTGPLTWQDLKLAQRIWEINQS